MHMVWQKFTRGRIAKGTLVALAIGLLLIPLLAPSSGVVRAAQATPSGDETTTAEARPRRPMVQARRMNRVQDRCVRQTAFAIAGARLSAALTDLVADGTLTQAEADAVKAKLAEGRDGDESAAGTPVVDGFGAAQDRRHSGPCTRLAVAAGLLATAADVIGLPKEDIAARLVAGESLAEIAESEEISRDALIAALEAPILQRLDEAVATSRLSETERTERATALHARLEAFVDHRRRR